MYNIELMNKDEEYKLYIIKESLIEGNIERLISMVDISKKEAKNYINTWKDICSKSIMKMLQKKDSTEEDEELSEILRELLSMTETKTLKLK